MLQQDIPDYLATPDTATDSTLDKALQTPVPVALLKTLQDGGVEQIDLSGRDMATSAARIRAVLGSGHEALQANDIAPPNLEHFYTASDLVKSKGLGLDDALAQVRAQEPLSVSKQELTQAAGEQSLSSAPQNWHPPLALGQSPASQPSPADDTIALTPENIENIKSTNFCAMGDLDRFRSFITLQGTERAVGDDFVMEKIADNWEDLPETVRNYEPDGRWASFVDDKGDHAGNQRFEGGYHIHTEENADGEVLNGVYLHFDAHDPMVSFNEMLRHNSNEVDRIKSGDLSETYMPPPGSSPQNSGAHPDYDKFEDYCNNL